jgi:hypothetical protein
MTNHPSKAGIKLSVLKSGEQIIAWTQDLLSSEEIGDADPKYQIGYKFTRPCIVECSTQKPKTSKGSVKKSGYKVTLTPWLPLCKTDPICIPMDVILTQTAPVDALKTMYMEDVGMTESGMVSIEPPNLPSNREQTQAPEQTNGQDNQDSSTVESTDSD